MNQAVAIVTGTNSGLGLALAIQLAKSSHKVYAGMRSIAKAGALNEAAAAAGVTDNISVIEMDVNSDESVASAVDAVMDESGRCDVLVNNAGYSVFGSVEMLDMQTMLDQLNTNLFGVIRTTKAVLPTMRSQKSGKIINISSVGGVWGQPFNDIYCASKFAVEGLVESQAPLFKQFGVHVSSVQPGAIQTDFIPNAKKPDPAALPADYMEPITNVMAAYQQSSGSGQTADEVAQVIMDQIVQVENPPVKVQTNPAIQMIFDMKTSDPTGLNGRDAAIDRFLTSKV
jgi:NAD(P)-dependent dehydrogenase (short-subunit alcohol dehydrogenase family)